ncbi:GTP-binding protein [Halovenus sp. WSH3]|uniref:GTP-binding protein n=1 Tax=Halovenus carboxidivorans TaxID=2692199 RepID=A0A6B0T0E5_9EURY|nr:GTP-binding protein [Halovenus carboxidivorans]MXR50697.1 GTP-binding protein [Halovenus carboxidivorans]
MGEEIPVTVLSGPLGAGKTTLVNHLLSNSGDRSIAVLVNDMGEINVDAELLSAGTEVAADGGVAELSNGCICCELQDDLETEVARLASEREFEYLVVEASGISEPEPVARLFTTGSRAAAAYELDTMVTVVDTARFLDAFGDAEGIERETAPGSTDRPLSDLLVEQIEFADVILLNKADLLDAAELDRAEELVRALVPRAEIHRTTHSQIDPGAVLGTGRFDPAETGSGAGWQHGLDGDDAPAHGDHDHAHPDEVYNVSSFVYRRRRPFHPERIRALLGDLPSSVVRSKGLLWIAGRDESALLMSQAGAHATVEVLGPWLASLPEIEREMYRSNRPDVEWDDEHGDRRTELVFIGQEIDDSLIGRLDDCLVTDEEWGEGVETGVFPSADEEALSVETR